MYILYFTFEIGKEVWTKMPKLKNPPQGGEKYLCLTLFATMAASVVSAVICIYCIVIIYKPSKEVLDSKIGKKCALYLVVGPVKLIFTFKFHFFACSLYSSKSHSMYYLK